MYRSQKRHDGRTDNQPVTARNPYRLNEKGATGAPFRTVAEWTGLEPATSGVTGQHSNQLNYHSAFFWWVL